MFKKIQDKLKSLVDHDKTENKVVEDSPTSKTTENKKKEKKVSETIQDLNKDSKMNPFFSKVPNLPKVGDVIEGKVINVEKGAVYVDTIVYGTGIIYGKEYLSARDVIKRMNIGDTISSKVVDLSHPEGYLELSLKEARQALMWSEAEEALKNKTGYELTIKEANKGGLMIDWQGIAGFLPASQLKSDHYPRVGDGDKDKILEELKKLIGKKILVNLITVVPKEGKIIFSEKVGGEIKDKEKMVGKYHIGDEVEGTVTGIVDFGVFIKIEDGLEGLVHISEIDWSLVEDPKMFVKVGTRAKAKIIDIKDNKISLSMKALKPNPWIEAQGKYKKDSFIDGIVIKFNKHGALASVEEGIAGLVHISEFGNEVKMKQKLEIGKKYNFKITVFDPREQKMALALVEKSVPKEIKK